MADIALQFWAYRVQAQVGISSIYEPRHEETAFCVCKRTGTDQLCCNRAADLIVLLFSLHTCILYNPSTS